MRLALVPAIILLFCGTGLAAISTTTTLIDQNFVGVSSVYIVDLDGDGDMDIVGAANAGNEVAWWENNGSQVFTKWSVDAAYNGAVSVIPFDMDRDGDIDIVACGANSVSWWENSGTPRQNNWAAQWDISAAFAGVNSLCIYDVNRDGRPDVLATGGANVTWWEGPVNARQNNWPNQWNVTAAFANARAVTALDMDLDGDIDILAAGGNNVSWWENNGIPGQNNWATQWNIDTAFNGANSIFYLDIDKDGDIDVMSTAGTGAGALSDVSWWENSGNPRSNGWTEYTIDDTYNGTCSIYIADIDFDGDYDVIGAANTDNDVSWWENTGNPRANAWTERQVNINFNGACSIFPADLDSDGDLDIIAAASLDNDIAWWQNDANRVSGNIGFRDKRDVELNINGVRSLAICDMDFDGDNDIVAAAAIADDIAWFENDSTPLDGGWITHIIDNNFDGADECAIVDLDRDGDLDIAAVASNADQVAWWDNNGSEVFTKRVIDNSFNGANTIHISDIDRDGDPDIVAGAGLGDEIAWWVNDGTPAVGGWIKNTVDAGLNGPTSVFCADIDSDGDIDIIASSNVSDDVVWYDNSGAQVFTKREIDNNFNGAACVRASDIDTDGDLDVVACGYDGNTVAWWSNDGTPANGGWTKLIVDGAANGVIHIEITDIDQDGDLDIAGALKVADDVVWWENDGSPLNGGWIKHIVNADFNGAACVLCDDIDRDGEIDVTAAAEVADDISWWENGGSAAVTPARVGPGATAFLDVSFTVADTPKKTVTSATSINAEGLQEGSSDSKGEEQEVDVKCFIATACTGSPHSYEVYRLSVFRDKYLMTSAAGRFLVEIYYKASPPLARYLSRNTIARQVVKFYITAISNSVPQ